MKLENKVAIVTGGGKGIGAEICLRLVKEGAKIVIAEMDVKSGENIQKKIIENKGEAIVINTNVADEVSVNNMADEAVKKFGKIDILINNAGIRHINNILDHTKKQWDEMISVNLTGPYPVSYTHLRAHETGRNLVCRLLLEKKKNVKMTFFSCCVDCPIVPIKLFHFS